MTEGVARVCGEDDDSLIVVCDRGRLWNIKIQLVKKVGTVC